MLSFLKDLLCKNPLPNQESFSYINMNQAYYPACEVVLYRNKQEFKYTFIIDSGADISLVPKSIGEQLELKKGQLRYLGGISGRMGYYINQVQAEIAGKQFKMELAWATKDTVPLLLGRKSVFKNFKICFNEKKKTVFFS